MNQDIPPRPPNYVLPPAALPTSGLAVASLVTGILGFIIAPVVCSIIAIITGYSARKETRSVPPRASGDGMATAGIVMGYVQIGLIVVALCCVAAYFVFFLGLLGSGIHSQ
jgi:hypothetical protein